MVRTTIQAVSSRKEYKKFFGVLFFIFVASVLMSSLISFSWQGFVRWYVGSSLLLFGGLKLISFESFQEVFPRYDPLAARYNWYAQAYPLIEVLLGIFYILDLAPGPRYIVTFVLLAFGLAGMVTNLDRQGPSTHNTWLGNIFRLPMSTAILFEDAIVASLAAILLIAALIG